MTAFRRMLAQLGQQGPSDPLPRGEAVRGLEAEEEGREQERQRAGEDDVEEMVSGRRALLARFRAETLPQVAEQRFRSVELLLTLGCAIACVLVEFAINAVSGSHAAGIEAGSLRDALADPSGWAGAFALAFTVGSVGGATLMGARSRAFGAIGVTLLLVSTLAGALERTGVVVTPKGGLVLGGDANLAQLVLQSVAILGVALAGALCLHHAARVANRLLALERNISPVRTEIRDLDRELAKRRGAALAARDARLAYRRAWDADAAVAQADEESARSANAPAGELVLVGSNEARPAAEPGPHGSADELPGQTARVAPKVPLDPLEFSARLLLGALVLIGVAAAGFALGGCAPAAATEAVPPRSVLVVVDRTPVPGPGRRGSDAEARDLGQVLGELRLPLGSSVTAVVPGKGTTYSALGTASLAGAGISHDARLSRASFATRLIAVLGAQSPEAPGSSLFATLTLAVRDTVPHPTDVVVISDLREVSQRGRTRLNFERPPLPKFSAVESVLRREHVLPDLHGINLYLCGTDGGDTPAAHDDLLELWRQLLEAGGSPSVIATTQCSGLSAGWR